MQVLQPATIDVQPRCTLVHGADLQVSRLHDDTPATQLMSQAHDVPQLSIVHDSRPVHSTLHGPGPQVKLAQLARPPHVIAHALLLLQLMPARHALAVEHAMLQLQPLGQITGRAQPPLLSAQSIVQLFMSGLHDVHCAGQAFFASIAAASTCAATQNPSVQVRPELQSDCC